MTRCVGAYLRVCLRLTDCILCEQCWRVVMAGPKDIRRRYWPAVPPLVVGSALALPFRGDVS